MEGVCRDTCLQAEALAFSLLRYGMCSEGRPDSLEVSTLYSHLGFDVSSERTTLRVSLMSPICRYRLSIWGIHSGARVAFRACERLFVVEAAPRHWGSLRIWRRVWDSNPRKVSLHLFSRQAP